MKAGGRNLKVKPTRMNSWQRPCFLDRAWLTGCLVLWRSSQLFFSFADLHMFPLLFLQKLPANLMGYFCCGCSGGPKLAFHWSAVCPGWQPLWWGVISFQNFRSQKLVLHFCVDFLASSELIGYIDLTDCYEIWPKCSLVISAKKGVRLFWYSKYFSFWGLSCAEDRQIFNSPLQNNFSRQAIGISKKPLVAFRSLSATDWHYAVCLVVLASRKVGNSV